MISIVNKITERVLVIIFVVMTLSVVWQVLSRYLLSISASFTEELARYCLMWLAILGAAYITGKREHIAIDFFADKLPESSQYFLNVIIEILILVFAVIVLIIGGGYLMYMTFYMGQISPALKIPLGYIYTIIPVSGILMVIYTIVHLRLLKENKNIAHES